MHILVIDGSHVEAEFRAKFGPAHQYRFLNPNPVLEESGKEVDQQIQSAASTADVAFCFHPLTSQVASFFENDKLPIFEEIIHLSLTEMLSYEAGLPAGLRFGFCGLPTLFNRFLLEVSLYHEADREKLAETCAALGTDYRVVADRVGLVTPRVICQIINEACFTVQEGTATMQDVDLGMKLGTNYPHGPFAWANAIGVTRVYAVLKAMWDDTHDERYKVCPLLKRQALRGEPFAV
ncbi:hypothetical protein GCM10011495_23670 [Hymenobacter frigidus]|uniref:3-hydroxyacyl-CoA dehydrogenase C-terminal domain-containing protein n=1 Tax=Hymenobacter frigidus TaxID=1524095 RepID=A0ABQ2A8A5_9BACT|nr:3-hydroxyacyl-CoA dehydrogenase family protein [Hymenobacter frigidus]GGH86636.1 hypothetical protein GCM10011495_23670 [Hymenobacter frigidus]